MAAQIAWQHTDWMWLLGVLVIVVWVALVAAIALLLVTPTGGWRSGRFDHPEGTDARRTVVKAKPGDKIVIKGHHVGEPDRDAVVLEVRDPEGQPPYRVRWSDDGREGLFFPGSDATVVHYAHSEQA
jgi:hypothetical protein